MFIYRKEKNLVVIPNSKIYINSKRTKRYKMVTTKGISHLSTTLPIYRS